METVRCTGNIFEKEKLPLFRCVIVPTQKATASQAVAECFRRADNASRWQTPSRCKGPAPHKCAYFFMGDHAHWRASATQIARARATLDGAER